MKNLSSGVFVLAAVVGVYMLFKVVAILAFLFMPVLLVLAAVYLVGHWAPKDLHEKAEAQLRKGLDHLDFKAPTWTWPWIKRAREFLDWFGLEVKKAA